MFGGELVLASNSESKQFGVRPVIIKNCRPQATQHSYNKVVADFAAMQTKARSVTLQALSILIADDDADTMLTLSELLRDEGHAVHTCADATVVLEALERYAPDVCILDIVMPRKTGFALAREIVAMK